jgi:hypothetical protein
MRHLWDPCILTSWVRQGRPALVQFVKYRLPCLKELALTFRFNGQRDYIYFDSSGSDRITGPEDYLCQLLVDEELDVLQILVSRPLNQSKTKSLSTGHQFLEHLLPNDETYQTSYPGLSNTEVASSEGNSTRTTRCCRRVHSCTPGARDRSAATYRGCNEKGIGNVQARA